MKTLWKSKSQEKVFDKISCSNELKKKLLTNEKFYDWKVALGKLSEHRKMKKSSIIFMHKNVWICIAWIYKKLHKNSWLTERKICDSKVALMQNLNHKKIGLSRKTFMHIDAYL